MILIKNGNLLTMENDNVIVGDVLIEGDKIVKIGQNIEVDSECEVIDATDKYVMPGIIDAHCHIGLWEDGMDDDDGDGNEMTDPITPQLRAIDGINPFDNAFVVHDIKVIEGQDKLFTAMPSRKTPNNEFKDIAHPINSQMRETLEKAIIDKYNEVDQEEASE